MVFYKNLYKIYLDIIQVQPVFSLLLRRKGKGVCDVFVGYLKLLNGYFVLSAKIKRNLRKSANIENILSSHLTVLE